MCWCILNKCLSKNDLQETKIGVLHPYKQLKDIEKEKFEKLVISESKVKKKEDNIVNRILKS